MSTAPAAPANHSFDRNQSLYQALVREAAAGGAGLMGKLVAAARLALQAQEAATRDLRERDALANSANQLRQFELQLCKSYPDALLLAFADPEVGKRSSNLKVAEVQFDQLELMDDTQVLTSVTLARIQQSAMQISEVILAELNTLICSLLGLGAVRADVNPLRPEAYVNALKEVVDKTQATPAMQLQWCGAMSATLGLELRTFYVALCSRLRKDGVMSVAYSMPSARSAHGTASRTPAFPSSAPGAMGYGPESVSPALQNPSLQNAASPASVRTHGKEDALLTLDKLRKLLSGELGPAPTASRVEQFAAQFAQQFDDDQREGEGTGTGFDATLPAALQALTDMKQVDRVVQSLEQRRGGSTAENKPQEHSIEGQRLALRRNASNVAQALSLEVVTLMVDNMAHDPRLLEPVRQVIRNLEPALLRLALVDPRFFSDKQHPARRLLQAVTHRSMAFESSAASGFVEFLTELQAVLAPLFSAAIENAEIFETKLALLLRGWSQYTEANANRHDTAVEVLQHAEARNLLAERIAQGIESHPDSTKVSPVVIDFLCGPWAQVVAQARIKQGAGSAAAEKFEALIPALLWSAHPELARASPSKLTRLVPRLLTTLREGLELIHFPGTRTSLFLEALMAIHQQAFRAPGAAATAPKPQVLERHRPVLDDNPWMAPEEAAASNFVELKETPDKPLQSDTPIAPDMLIVAEPETFTDGDLPLGSWVEMWVNEQWVRTQLTWASPHGTLYLFTGVFGTTQSMTRRSRDKLLATGKLRLISGRPVDEGALDAVAQTALRNSLDSAL